MITFPLAIVLASWLPSLLTFSYEPADGDVIFQTSHSRQSKALQAVTGSRYTHMGVVLLRGGKPFVYEAVGPVKYTPLDEWVAKGVDAHFVVKRLGSGPLTAEQIKALKNAGAPYEGKDYDLLFAWSDKQIYCSELVWKMFKSALNVEVGAMQRFRDFDLSTPLAKAIVKERWGSRPPLNEPVITPVAMFNSPLLRTVYKR